MSTRAARQAERRTYEMPYKRRSNEGVGHRGESQPDDDDHLELLELYELWYHADRD